MIRFYNTLTKRVDNFKPLKEGKVGLYFCGPTVYDYAHIGNFRAYIFGDLLKRFLKFSGYKVTHVMNITDVEDRIIEGAIREEVSIVEYTKEYTEAFFKDFNTLRIQPPDIRPKATEHIDEMLDLIERLEKKGFTYERDGSVYYRINKFDRYGNFAGIDRSQLIEGARIESDRYDKDNVHDFALWKAKKLDDEPCWESKYGCGRPGWHIECSAMSMKYLGEKFDIHCGGIDLIFPHHENEIAQSEGATGERFVNYWLHCAHLQADGQKMSKSLGNFYTLRDLIAKGIDPVAIRYLLISSHYRNPLNFTFDSVEQAVASIERLRDFKRRLERERPSDGDKERSEKIIADADRGFREKIEDDLNISGALGEIFTFIREINLMLDNGELTEEGRTNALNLLLRWDQILDVLRESRAKELDIGFIEDMIQMRNEAREEKDWSKADAIRENLFSKGIVLEDTPQGTTWKRK
jgi:cysteinyl-tRNA synthetase